MRRADSELPESGLCRLASLEARDLAVIGPRASRLASRLRAGLPRFVSGTHALALADQAVVSGASFLAIVMIGRWTDPGELGAYAIAISLLVSALAIQEALISLPYAIRWRRPPETAAEHAGSALTHSALLSGLAVVFLAATALGLSAHGAAPSVVTMTWTLTAVLPFALLREFGRRFAFARLHLAQALILDAAAAAIQLAALLWLGWTGRLSAVTACAALGGACGLTALVWLYLARADFAIRPSQAPATIKQSWGLGKWLFAGQIIMQAQIYAPYWLLLAVAGAAATGVYSACMSVVAFANPLIMGFSNILTPKAVLAWKEGGGARLRRQAIQDALALGAVTALFCAAVLLAGEDLVRLLYHGKEYEGHGATLTVLALALLAAAVGMPATNALASMERPRAIVWAGSIGALLTTVLVWRLMAEWGLLGAAYGVLVGNIAGSVGRWAAFLALVPRSLGDARN